MKIIIELPDANLDRILDAYAHGAGYPTLVGGQTNPQSKLDFMKASFISTIRQFMINYEVTAIDVAAEEKKKQDKRSLEDNIKDVNIIINHNNAVIKEPIP